MRWYRRQNFTPFPRKAVIICFCDPVSRFDDGLLEWVTYRLVEILLLAKILFLSLLRVERFLFSGFRYADL